MRLRPVLPAALLATLAVALVAAAAPATAAVELQQVRGGSDGMDAVLTPTGATIAWLDADGDLRAGEANPDEPIYLDMDHDGRASFGDIRLTAFAAYPAGTLVDVTSRDYGLTLATSAGWFASSEAGWFLDLDASATVSAGDVRADGPRTATKVQPGDAGTGSRLTVAQNGVTAPARIGVRDLDQDGKADLGEPLYLDLDGGAYLGSRKVTEGDLRLLPDGLSIDDGPTRAEFDAAVSQAAAGRDAAGNPVLAAEVDEARPGWRALDWILVAIGVLNLAGLAIVYKVATQPRHPFR